MPASNLSPDSPRRSQRARRAILAAALDLVEEAGYAKLSIEGIAARAGVGKQTIYRWWGSKGSVLLDALLALSEDEDGEVMGLPDTGDLEATSRSCCARPWSSCAIPGTTGRCAPSARRSSTTPCWQRTSPSGSTVR